MIDRSLRDPAGERPAAGGGRGMIDRFWSDPAGERSVAGRRVGAGAA